MHTTGGMAVTPQGTQFVIVGNNSNSGLASTMGTFILIYGIFRIGVVFFLGMFWDDFMNEYVIESILAFLIGTSYVFGGMMILAGYRNGVICAWTLVFSGLLSFVYNDEWSPLIGLDGFTIHLFLLSILYDSYFPLLVAPSELKDGWPEGIQRIIDNSSKASKSKEENPNCGNHSEFQRNSLEDAQVVKPWLRFEQSPNFLLLPVCRFLYHRWAILPTCPHDKENEVNRHKFVNFC